MNEAEARTQRDAVWWSAWRAQDFTWEGLARKPWEGWIVTKDGFVVLSCSGQPYGTLNTAKAPSMLSTGRRATLQDYWYTDPKTGRLRNDAEMDNELVQVDGQPTYHRAHLPLAYADGTPTSKIDWPDNALDALLNARLLVAEETAWGGKWFARKPDGPDTRAQLQGCVLLRASGHPEGNQVPLSANYENTAVTRDARFEDTTFSGDARFDSTNFLGNTRFDRANFSGDAWFDKAIFSGDVWFENATFARNTWFERAIFGGYAGFVNTTFHNATSFKKTQFQGLVAFENARLHPATSFDGTLATAVDHVAFWARAIGSALLLIFVVAALAALSTNVVIAIAGTIAAALALLPMLAWFLLGGSWLARRTAVDLERHSRAFRTLAQHMEGIRNRPDLARFYRRELIATRLRTQTNPFERLFSVFYDITSNYGDSIPRPLLSLTALIVTFAAVFGLRSHNRDDLAHALWFSILNVVKPMHVWTVDFAKGARDLSTVDPYWHWVGRLFSNPDPYAQIGLRTLASVESILALALVFLAALAIRRKFQLG